MLKTDIACNRSVLGEALKSILDCITNAPIKDNKKGIILKLMKPSLPMVMQHSVVMKEKFTPQSNKTLLISLLLVLVLVSLAFAAGVFFGPSVVSRFGMKTKTNPSRAEGELIDNLQALPNDETPSACITSDDLQTLLENATASLKSSLENVLKRLNSLEIKPNTKEPLTQSPITQGVAKAESNEGIKIFTRNTIFAVTREARVKGKH